MVLGLLLAPSGTRGEVNKNKNASNAALKEI
jgi:hypothetical protein